jgi:hypothetical protein
VVVWLNGIEEHPRGGVSYNHPLQFPVPASRISHSSNSKYIYLIEEFLNARLTVFCTRIIKREHNNKERDHNFHLLNNKHDHPA